MTIRERTTLPAAAADALRVVQMLLLVFLTISVATLVAVVLLRDHHDVVDSAVWVRTIIVAADGVLMLAFARAAARGSRGGFRRLRIISAITVVAIVVIVALPGAFPVWLRIEQALCGVVMLGVAGLANGGRLRRGFPRTATR